MLRNRVKRWIRECYRRRRPEFPPGLDLVVVARPPAAKADHGVVCSELASLAPSVEGRAREDDPARPALDLPARTISPVLGGPLPVRADLLGLRRGGAPDTWRLAGRLAGALAGFFAANRSRGVV